MKPVPNPEPSHSAEASSPALIDTNVSLGRWPFRRGPMNEMPALADKLRANGVTQGSVQK